MRASPAASAVRAWRSASFSRPRPILIATSMLPLPFEAVAARVDLGRYVGAVHRSFTRFRDGLPQAADAGELSFDRPRGDAQRFGDFRDPMPLQFQHGNLSQQLIVQPV